MNEGTSATETDHATRSMKSAGGYSFLYALAVAVVGAIVAFNVIRPITVLPRITPSPGYAFTNQHGQISTSEDQRGKLTLYSFTYADCAANEPCPLAVDQIGALRHQLGDIPSDIPLSFVTISLNPEIDTQTKLAEMNEDYSGTDLASTIPWTFLSGDSQRTRLVVGGGFQVFYSEPKSEAGGRVDFEPRYVLVDHLGIIRAEYRTAEPDPELITRDIDLILNEANNSDGIARLGYEAAHLFLCYPR